MTRAADYFRVIGMASAIIGAAVALEAAATGSERAAKDPPVHLHGLFKREWEHLLREQPTLASSLGDRRYADRWPDVSPGAIEKRLGHQREVLGELKTLNPQALSDADRLNYTLFRKKVEFEIEGHAHGGQFLAINQREGIQTAYDLADSLVFASTQDYEAWLARLKAFPGYMDQTIELMRAGVSARIVHPKIILERLPEQVKKQLVSVPEQSPFYKPFRSFPATLAAAERDRLASAAKEAIRKDVVPAFERLQAFLKTEYLPAGYGRVGIWQFPKGEAAYAFYIREHTDTSLTAEAIHQIGQREVARIRREMQDVISRTGFQGSFRDFLQHLRTRPEFYCQNRSELLTAYESLSKRIDPTLVRLFRRMPRMPYGVEPIPDHIAPDTTTAYYRPPAADGSRAGTYFVNLYRPETRPKYEMEALSLHEAVPGHHFQIALAMELGELPEFRRYGHYTAYVEGWALYAESLGDELGLYRDPYSKFGQLTYEMWRAVRLVVDTGMHQLGWTREQAIEFFRDNAAKTELDITNEIDRYIAWPGQALAYKIGELKIKELRQRARRELGERFDIREFHDAVLSTGAVPLDVLESHVLAWIEKSQGR